MISDEEICRAEDSTLIGGRIHPSIQCNLQEKASPPPAPEIRTTSPISPHAPPYRNLHLISEQSTVYFPRVPSSSSQASSVVRLTYTDVLYSMLMKSCSNSTDTRTSVSQRCRGRYPSRTFCPRCMIHQGSAQGDDMVAFGPNRGCRIYAWILAASTSLLLNPVRSFESHLYVAISRKHLHLMILSPRMVTRRVVVLKLERSVV